MEDLIKDLLRSIGEDPSRAGLRDTPRRMRQSLEYLTSGYTQDIPKMIKGAIFKEKYDEMVLVKGIDFFSLCEHHMLPFFGTCHLAYIPNGKIIGLSKLPRIVEAYSRRLQVQERLTIQIATCIQDAVQPLGVGVVMEGIHLCMVMRGVEKQNSVAVTSSMLGVFRKNKATRMEFLSLIGHKRLANSV